MSPFTKKLFLPVQQLAGTVGWGATSPSPPLFLSCKGQLGAAEQS